MATKNERYTARLLGQADGHEPSNGTWGIFHDGKLLQIVSNGNAKDNEAMAKREAKSYNRRFANGRVW